jgi:hypothetical protein
MSGKVANYSGALNVGDRVRLIAVPAHSANRVTLEGLIGREGIVKKKMLSESCVLWYYVSFQCGPFEALTFAVSRDMIR